mgnify:CR=1 FL=1
MVLIELKHTDYIHRVQGTPLTVRVTNPIAMLHTLDFRVYQALRKANSPPFHGLREKTVTRFFDFAGRPGSWFDCEIQYYVESTEIPQAY